MTRTRMIPANHGQLEAILDTPDSAPRAIAVFCHPHPLHGGNMHNKVVYHATKGLTEAKIAVLRFNFRGVGQSTGSHDGKEGERNDARQALEWLRDRYPDHPTILGGFSFGSMVACSLARKDPSIAGIIGIGLPLSLYDFSYLDTMSIPILIVQGENDQFASQSEINNFTEAPFSHLSVRIIPDVGHFLTDRYDQLKHEITEFLPQVLSEKSE